MSRRVIVTNAHRRFRIKRTQVGRYVRHVLRCEGKSDALISVVFVDSRFIRTLHRMYLGRDRVTDVISFPLEHRARLEGEIYVNLNRARDQAHRFHVSFENEVARLVIHGTLHLMGYDDRDSRKAAKMKTQEDRHVGFWFSKDRGKG